MRCYEPAKSILGELCPYSGAFAKSSRKLLPARKNKQAEKNIIAGSKIRIEYRSDSMPKVGSK
jgi:hypothetical protein